MAQTIACPSCKFPNFLTAKLCLLCKSALAGVESQELEDLVLPESSDATRAVAYLYCHPFEPVPLISGEDVTIGRVSECGLMLPHHSISRCHGTVQVRGDEITYKDSSSNGSFLNGKRLTAEVPVRPGDVLTVGPYDLEVLRDAPSEDDEESSERTSELDFSSYMSGLLEETSIYEVLQSLEYNSKSGSLSIIAGRLRGSLLFVEGQPWRASYGDLHDEEAVLKILELRVGRYLFGATGEEPGERKIKSGLTALLLEGSRQLDEHSTHLDVDPPTQLF
ncbi:MAG: DUF4388 domain-containing protein [Planctomycetes bacterium]|nr:DUF4388 domain-containing protein [Planctomycetota bacterium]